MEKINLTSEEKEKVQQAIFKLEKACNGELVIYIARKSDSYIESCWKWATITGTMVLAVLAALSLSWSNPYMLTDVNEAIIIFGGMLYGFALPYFFPRLRLKMVSPATVRKRIMTRAHDIFLQKELFETSQRTGILFYISELEHNVTVLGDKGINAKIEQEDWVHVVNEIVQGIKSNNLPDGLIKAIQECEKLLLANDFKAVPGSTNELKDEIFIED